MEILGYRYVVFLGSSSSPIFTFLYCTIELDPSSFTSTEKNIASNGLGIVYVLSRYTRPMKMNHDVAQGQEIGLVFSLFEEAASAGSGTKWHHGNNDSEQECVSFPKRFSPLTIEFMVCNPPFYGTLVVEVEAAKGG